MSLNKTHCEYQNYFNIHNDESFQKAQLISIVHVQTLKKVVFVYSLIKTTFYLQYFISNRNIIFSLNTSFFPDPVSEITYSGKSIRLTSFTS